MRAKWCSAANLAVTKAVGPRAAARVGYFGRYSSGSTLKAVGRQLMAELATDGLVFPRFWVRTRESEVGVGG
jgi:hypothetical protein